jgi:MinD-like ATPase involved in chromosome partitioning or flagellar assembly
VGCERARELSSAADPAEERRTATEGESGRLAVLAVNRGVPFVVSHPESTLSRDVIKLARTLVGETGDAERSDKRGLFARR